MLQNIERYSRTQIVDVLKLFPNGILHANTAFGKTVAAIALIAERKVNTLIIVDRVSLLDQWCERLSVFLNIPKKEIGIIGGGKKKPTGISNRDLCEEHTTNELYDYLYINQIRNRQIVMDVRNCLDEKRYPIIFDVADILERAGKAICQAFTQRLS